MVTNRKQIQKNQIKKSYRKHVLNIYCKNGGANWKCDKFSEVSRRQLNLLPHTLTHCDYMLINTFILADYHFLESATGICFTIVSPTLSPIPVTCQVAIVNCWNKLPGTVDEYSLHLNVIPFPPLKTEWEETAFYRIKLQNN